MAKILLYASNAIGKTMAGPAIRTWEFAKALSQDHEVIVISPKKTDLIGEGFTLLSQEDSAVQTHVKSAQVLIAQTLPFSIAWTAKSYGIKIILDAYDPGPLEFLELFKQQPIKFRSMQNDLALLHLNFDFKMADSMICASEKQRDLWMGLLLTHHRLHPTVYDQDSSLRKLIDVVPFGLSSTPPRKTGPGLREKYGFKLTDKVILWGGGIWNWFDPLSLIQAIHLLQTTHPHVKLVFMGVKHPDDKVPEMSMCQKALQLAEELQLLNKSVFFNYGWVPYEERQNFLLDADIGASTHFDHLETRYSFRTRMLDYIWAKLPILATQGDSFAELIEQHQLGQVVPYQDTHALAQAIKKMIDDADRLAKIKANLTNMQQRFYWETITEPIRKMVKDLTCQPIKRLSYQDLKTFSCSVSRYTAIKAWTRGLKPLLVKVRNTVKGKPV